MSTYRITCIFYTRPL